ncbi:MAG: CopD family protein [Steroidobacteraceae bacterium]|nr:CopD family protein [Steroidobacteraceae bacterium]
MKPRSVGMLVALLGALLGVFAAPRVAAHAVLMKANPAANQQLDAAPKELELTFNENVGPVFFKVLDRAGKETGKPGELRIDGNSVFLPLGESLANGTYIVTYRVISADTHPVGGSFAFAIGEPVAGGAEAASGGAASAWVLPTYLNRVVLYASVLLAAGSALLLLVMSWPAAVEPGLRRQGRIAAIVAIVSFVVSMAVGGADIVAGGPGALFSGEAWSAAMKSTLSVSAAIGIPGALLAAWAFGAKAEWALWTGFALLVASFLVTGHAATAVPVWLAATNVGLHLAGGAFWFAAFAPLVATSRGGAPGDAAKVMDQFSSRALWLVGAVLLSGVIISWIQVRSPANLTTTDYGQRLLVKLGLVVAILAIAAYNKTTLTPALARSDAAAGAKMARSIRIESVVMLLIVAAAASLTLPTPPRALGEQAAMAAGGGAMVQGGEGYEGTWTTEGYAVEVEVTPGRTGENMVMLRFKDAAGAPVTMQKAQIDLALPEAQIEGVTLEGEAMPPDMFHFMSSEMIIPGEWTFTVNAFVSDFDKVSFEGKVAIK